MKNLSNPSSEQQNSSPMREKKILVTGATGYIGGRLIPHLLAAGYQLRVMVRGEAGRLKDRPWYKDVEVVVGDALKPDSLLEPLADIDTAFYLIHSMQAGEEYGERDRNAAHNFARAAEANGVRRMIYLGGLGESSDDLSTHLKSRRETGLLLRQSDVETIEFRAAIIIGSGSASFELLRNLTERLPLMVTPRWVDSCVQPIAIEDVLAYLTAGIKVDLDPSAKKEPAEPGFVVEIGGQDVMTYLKMIATYANVRELKRTFISVPFFTPELSSYWAHLITPIPASIARPLIKGLRNDVVVQSDTAALIFPDIKTMNLEAALHRALKKVADGQIESVWNDAQSSSLGDSEPVVFAQEQGLLIEKRERTVAAPAEMIFRAFASLGGPNGWPFQGLWQVRGLMDRLVGGVGLRRGRRHPNNLRTGDALDFWRVEAIEKNKLLRLRAEMKLPGNAWLQFEIVPHEDESDRCDVVQIAYFAPHGLVGLLYWYGLLPLHALIFPRMIERVAERAEMLYDRWQRINRSEGEPIPTLP